MLSVLLGVLALTGAAQADSRLVTCRAGEQDTELVIRRMGSFHVPYEPEFVSARLGGEKVELEKVGKFAGDGTGVVFGSPSHPYSFHVTFDGDFRVELKLFGDPRVIAEGRCDGRPT